MSEASLNLDNVNGLRYSLFIIAHRQDSKEDVHYLNLDALLRFVKKKGHGSLAATKMTQLLREASQASANVQLSAQVLADKPHFYHESIVREALSRLPGTQFDAFMTEAKAWFKLPLHQSASIWLHESQPAVQDMMKYRRGLLYLNLYYKNNELGLVYGHSAAGEERPSSYTSNPKFPSAVVVWLEKAEWSLASEGFLRELFNARVDKKHFLSKARGHSEAFLVWRMGAKMDFDSLTHVLRQLKVNDGEVIAASMRAALLACPEGLDSDDAARFSRYFITAVFVLDFEVGSSSTSTTRPLKLPELFTIKERSMSLATIEQKIDNMLHNMHSAKYTESKNHICAHTLTIMAATIRSSRSSVVDLGVAVDVSLLLTLCATLVVSISMSQTATWTTRVDK
eukprot:12395-Heterococcus_DN1.PRE.2